MARQPDGRAEVRDKIRALHRQGYKPREIAKMLPCDIRYAYVTINRYEYGPAGRLAQNVEQIFQMCCEMLEILRNLTKLRPAELRRRVGELAEKLQAASNQASTSTSVQSPEPHAGQAASSSCSSDHSPS